jgi:hypothetical protein
MIVDDVYWIEFLRDSYREKRNKEIGQVFVEEMKQAHLLQIYMYCTPLSLLCHGT